MIKKVAINGFGRIGRSCLKILLDNFEDKLEIVAINDLSDNEMLAYLLKYDSVQGIYNKEIQFNEKSLIVNNKEINIYAEKDPENLPWEELGVDIVLECTGFFRDLESASKHLKAGAKKVIISAPAKSDDINSYVLGVNEENYKGENIIDMGSCTTNCLAPVIKVLEDNLGIENGFMTTIHSYTANQNLLDGTHKDFRRSRAAAVNIVPTTTGAAKAVGKVVPSVDGLLDGMALRVPTPTVSIVDLTCNVKKEVSKQELNSLFEEYSQKNKNILKLEKKPLVSSDYIKDIHSSIVDAELTETNGKLIKVLAWYDNEWGYSNRLVEMCEFISDK